MKLRTQPARRWNAQSQRAQFGIVNWFASKKISSQDIIKECMYAFCQSNDFKNLSAKTNEQTIVNFVNNRFQKFAQFATKYLKENNYLNH